MANIRIPSDEEYLNEFHKKWNEDCMKERERTQSMHFSHEYAMMQSRRLAEIAMLSDDEVLQLKLERRK